MTAMGVGVFGHMPQAARLHCTKERVSSVLVKAPGKPSQLLVLSFLCPLCLLIGGLRARGWGVLPSRRPHVGC